ASSNNHLSSCEHRWVACKDCGATVRAHAMEHHSRAECSAQLRGDFGLDFSGGKRCSSGVTDRLTNAGLVAAPVRLGRSQIRLGLRLFDTGPVTLPLLPPGPTRCVYKSKQQQQPLQTKKWYPPTSDSSSDSSSLQSGKQPQQQLATAPKLLSSVSNAHSGCPVTALAAGCYANNAVRLGLTAWRPRSVNVNVGSAKKGIWVLDANLKSQVACLGRPNMPPVYKYTNQKLAPICQQLHHAPFFGLSRQSNRCLACC
uniref:C2H2-type domain-containing protein n=1 Tax=Macrostomum lignano TaxID=282301 RepID=A0A1I8FM19_9PLAT